MARTLRNILETYAPRSKDEKQFYNMHKVQVIKNLSEPTKDDKLFNATNIKTTSRKPDKHGYEPGEDLGKYDAGRATVPGTMKSVMGKQYAPTTTYESHTEKQLKQASADHTRKARVIVDTQNIGDPKVLRKFHQHDKAALIAARLVGKLAGQGKGNTSQLRKEDVKAPIQTDQQDKVFKDEDNSGAQIKKKKQKPHVNYYDGGSDKQVARMVAKHRANENLDEGDEKHILTLQNKDGSYDEVGMNNRHIMTKISRAKAVDHAKQLYNKHGRKVRVQSWAGHDFYKSNSKPYTAFYGKDVDPKKQAKIEEDINEEYESNYHYHQDQFLQHNRSAVEANQNAKHYEANADLGMKEDPERSAMHYNLADAYKKIATQHLKMAAHHARKSGIKSR